MNRGKGAMRIDAHIHFTPPQAVADLAVFAEEEPYWGLLMAGDATHQSIQGWATAERMIEDMDRAGIDRVMLMGEYRQRHEACVERNDQALALLRRWPDRISAFAVVQPKAGQKALDELARCLDAGMAGVGELGPYGQGYRLDDPDFLRLVEACIRRDVPINLHVNEEIGHFYLGKSTTPLLHYYRLACRYPELKLILAHWGGGLLFYELMPEVRRNLRNVWYDTAGSPLLFPTAAIFRAALDCVDHRKLLYASDYPLLLYPRRQTGPDFRPFIAEIDGLGLSAEVYEDIMGRNAARLLGLAPAEKAESAPPRRPGRQAVITEIEPEEGKTISGLMAVSAVAQAWPATQAVFERYGIPWRDSPVPYWEPIAQAAAARGLGPTARQRLLEELNTAI
ncbi:MAG: amidohydrolase family protein [Anaerolineae bacterium]